jgi:hypothetical protein
VRVVAVALTQAEAWGAAKNRTCNVSVAAERTKFGCRRHEGLGGCERFATVVGGGASREGELESSKKAPRPPKSAPAP